MSNNRRRGPRGGPGRGMAPGEKAKDLKGTMVKLIKYMRRFYVPIVKMCIRDSYQTLLNQLPAMGVDTVVDDDNNLQVKVKEVV